MISYISSIFDGIDKELMKEGRSPIVASFANPRLRTDIIETSDCFIIECEAPGLNKDDISIDFDNNIITIMAEQDNSANINELDNVKYLVKERYKGRCMRKFEIPGRRINKESVTAEYKNGLLVVKIMKTGKESSEDTRINID